MEGQTLRTIQGKLRVLESTNKFVMPVEVKALNSEVNRNGWKYINLEKHLSSFAQIPLLTAYNMGGTVIGGGHQFDSRIDPDTGEKYASFTAADAERIVGWVGDNAARIEVIDGVEWVICKCAIWSFYASELAKKIARQGSMEVSIETLVTKEHMEGDVAVEEEYIVLGITILGDGVVPAVAGANVKTLSMLSKMREAMHDNILKAASYIEKGSETVQEENNTLKGVGKLTYFTKKQCAELTKRFDGYTVLAAAQGEDNVIHVALLSKAGDTAVYKMESADETIAPERIVVCGATVAFNCDGNAIEVGLDAVTEELTAANLAMGENCKNLQAEIQKVNEALTTAMGTIAEMRNAENARRVASAKASALNTLKAFNAASAFEVPASAIAAVNADIDSGMYTERVNAEGAWIGEADVVQRVKAICADEQTKVNKANAEKNKNLYIWEKLNNEENDDDTIAGLLRRKGIE